MSRFLNPSLAALAPYTPGEQPQNRKFIKLNTNESPYPPSEKVQRAVGKEASLLHLYPDILAAGLTKEMADTLGVQPENVLMTNGSDEILAFIFQSFCEKGVAFADLTYGFYPVYCKLYGVRPQIIPLADDFSLRPEDYANLHKTIVIANPNAPTGLALELDQIEAVLQSNPDSLVVLDEAYVDFGAQSSVALLDTYENLLVVGTFSKSRSMAGARLGYAAAGKELIEDLNRIKFSFNPYNVNRMTMAAGLASLQDRAYYQECWKKVVATRERTSRELEQLGFSCTQSRANFIFATHPMRPAQELYLNLKEQGILVRWFNQDRIKNHLRITVGDDAQMDALTAALKEMVQ